MEHHELSRTKTLPETADMRLNSLEATNQSWVNFTHKIFIVRGRRCAKQEVLRFIFFIRL